MLKTERGRDDIIPNSFQNFDPLFRSNPRRFSPFWTGLQSAPSGFPLGNVNVEKLALVIRQMDRGIKPRILNKIKLATITPIHRSITVPSGAFR